MTRITDEWLTGADTQAVFSALTAEGHVAYAVGGCVRNSMLGVPVTDVDIATDATPEEVQHLAKKAGLRSVPTGIEHGTITIVTNGIGYEVTTFRADVDTHGRHATVRFSTDMVEDAARRDFTMNAVYADANGTVADPLGGLPDLMARRLRFIGDASQRIREDYLRILRYFRFWAWYADTETGFDFEALAAIAGNLAGLETLSQERVTSELTKLLSAPDPAPAVATMDQTGVLATILPGATREALAPLVHLESEWDVRPNAIRRLAIFGQFEVGALRLPKKAVRKLALFRSLISEPCGAAEMAYRHDLATSQNVLLLRAAVFETPVSRDDWDAAEVGAKAGFPVRAADLMPEYQGAELGRKLSELEAKWISSGFTLSRDTLLN